MFDNKTDVLLFVLAIPFTVVWLVLAVRLLIGILEFPVYMLRTKTRRMEMTRLAKMHHPSYVHHNGTNDVDLDQDDETDHHWYQGGNIV